MEKKLNILLVAPDVGKSLILEETRKVSKILQVSLLMGEVTRVDLIDMLLSRKWDIVWFATHGDAEGILLSDGKLPTKDLIPLIRSSQAELLFLNTCSSKVIALELFYELRINIISTESDIEDKTAMQTGILFAQSLVAENWNYKKAFEVSKSNFNENYFFLEADSNEKVEEIYTILLLNRWGATLSSKLAQLEKQWLQKLEDLKQYINYLEQELKKMKRIFLSYILFLVPTFVILLTVSLLTTFGMKNFILDWNLEIFITLVSYVSLLVWFILWTRREK
jgi:hypothetical protein